MKNILIKNNLNNYNIILGYDAFSYFLESFNFPKKVLVVITESLSSKYIDYLFDKGFDVYKVNDGEELKSFDHYQDLISMLIKKEYAKSDLIIAIGGGTILDLCGFIASTYKRGINYIMVPTTLLSIVDASIGGKNGLNFGGIKNVIGSFYMPNMIIDSLDFLETLSDKEYVSGLMETLKAGIIGDKEIINILKNNNLKDIRNNIFIAEEIIERSIDVKKKIVEIDPYEEDLRRVLNLGHTIGHAIEALNFGDITHGEAIAIGMIPFLSDRLKEEIKEIIKKYLSNKELNLDKEKLFNLIKQDKKIKDNKLHIVYVNDYEDCKIKEIEEESILEKLNELNIWK